MGKTLKINTGYDNPTIIDANAQAAKKADDPKDAEKLKEVKLTPPAQARQRGRPAKNPEELRSERLSVALTRQEVQDLQDLSAASGMGTSEIIRVVIRKLIDAQDMDNVRKVAHEREESKIQI